MIVGIPLMKKYFITLLAFICSLLTSFAETEDPPVSETEDSPVKDSHTLLSEGYLQLQSGQKDEALATFDQILKQDADTGYWWDIGCQKAMKKAGQAMREDAPEIKRKTGDGKEASPTIRVQLHQSPQGVQVFLQQLQPQPAVLRARHQQYHPRKLPL